jgi:hypothetical protein
VVEPEAAREAVQEPEAVEAQAAQGLVPVQAAVQASAASRLRSPPPSTPRRRGQTAH